MIPENNLVEGGIKDYGNFKEGFCFKIETEIPNEKFVQTKENLSPLSKKNVRWIICNNNEKEKTRFMDILINLKIKNQRLKNLYIDINDTKSKSGVSNNPIFSTIKKYGVGSIYEETKDCKMLVLHDWSECNLSCGGGKSYMQLMKVMKNNKPDAEDCKTKESILIRDCNLQPCPNVNEIQRAAKNLKMEDLVASNVIVKMMPISSRPQRYDKCHLKETDALIVKNDESVKEFSNISSLPVRLVMNNKTLTAYRDDTLTNRISTYLLEESTFIRIKDKTTCFIIRNNVNEDQFCMLDTTNTKFVQEWDFEFNLFKNQCKKNRVQSNETLEKSNLIKQFNNKVEDLKLELIREKSDLIKKEVEEDEKKNLVSKIDQVRKTSLHALEKEMHLEDLLEKEEQSKEEEENKTLETQIQSEKRKEECLLKAIKEKEIENQYNIAKSKAEKAIEQIAKETQQEILEKRKTIAKKISEMKLKQMRKKAQLKNEILSIRGHIAERLQKINKAGNKDKCIKKSNKTSYCNLHFSDNYIKFGECQNDDSFCYVCCENEFGELHVLDRDACYSVCDELKNQNSNIKF